MPGSQAFRVEQIRSLLHFAAARHTTARLAAVAEARSAVAAVTAHGVANAIEAVQQAHGDESPIEANAIAEVATSAVAKIRNFFMRIAPQKYVQKRISNRLWS